MLGYTLPTTGTLDPGIRPLDLNSGTFVFIPAFFRRAAKNHRRVSINTDLNFIDYRGHNHAPLPRR